MARQKKDKLVAVKLTGDELLALDELCDMYDSDRSKVLRLAIRSLHSSMLEFLVSVTDGDVESMDKVRSWVGHFGGPKNFLGQFHTWEDWLERRKWLKEHYGLGDKAKKSTKSGGDTNDDDQ